MAAAVLVVVLAVAAVVVGDGRAGSVRTTFTVHVLPHFLTLGAQAQGLFTTDFTNAGPSTINHVFETINVNLPPGSVSTPSGCQEIGTNTAIITCDIGQFPPGSLQELGRFDATALVAPATVTVSAQVTFDEGKNNGLVDTQTGTDQSNVTTSNGTVATKNGNANVNGQCLVNQVGNATLTASNNNQKTFLSYPGLSAFYCTPGDAGVTIGHPSNPKGLFGDTSFVEFLAGSPLSTVQITIFNPPSKVTKSNLYFVEYANYPDDLTPTNNGNPIPQCQFDSNGNPVIPPGSGYVSCVVSITNYPGGGLLATLAVQGGSDAGWGTG